MTITPMLDWVVDQCAAEGVAISVDGGKLVITGQHTTIEEWRPLLRSLKSELLERFRHPTAVIQRRAAAFITRGVDATTACELARHLQTRNSLSDERRLCLECSCLSGTQGVYRCTHWRHAELAGPQVPRELPFILQRCKAFQVMSKQ
jgi:hypothetical protein